MVGQGVELGVEYGVVSHDRLEWRTGRQREFVRGMEDFAIFHSRPHARRCRRGRPRRSRQRRDAL